MKKIKCLLCISMFLFLVSSNGFKVYASEVDSINFSYYVDSDDLVHIMNYCGEDETVIIPAEIDGKKVKYVRFQDVKSCAGIKHIIIQEGVTEIGVDAFHLCLNLETVSIPEGVTYIGSEAFRGCKLTNINIPSTVQTIEPGAFFECRELKSVSLSEGITKIGDYMFGYCYSLENIDIPSTVQIIGNHAFRNCKGLNNISMPDNISDIGDYAFYYCTELDDIKLPENITNIGEYAFAACKSLSYIKIPKNMKRLKKITFYGCINLQKVEIEEGVTTIEEAAFSNCTSLKSIVIPNSINYMDENVFTVAKSYLQDDTTVISHSGLLSNITIYADPDSYAKTYANQQGIKFSCIDEHLNIVTDNEVKPTCTTSGKTEGRHCEACGTIIVEQTTITPTGHKWNSGTITTKPTAVNDGIRTYICTACGTKKTETIPKLGLPQNGNTVASPDTKDTYKVTKPATQNGTVEFASVDKTKGSITIPDTITVDGITYKVTSISKNAFKNNKNLKKVAIGKNITIIGANAFYGCKNLKTITIKSTNLKIVSKNAFKGINSKAKIKVPKSKLKKYKKLLKGKGQKSTVKITK